MDQGTYLSVYIVHAQWTVLNQNTTALLFPSGQTNATKSSDLVYQSIAANEFKKSPNCCSAHSKSDM